jgi:hypothetical protein
MPKALYWLWNILEDFMASLRTLHTRQASSPSLAGHELLCLYLKSFYDLGSPSALAAGTSLLPQVEKNCSKPPITARGKRRRRGRVAF